jgi:hypothetical protein
MTVTLFAASRSRACPPPRCSLSLRPQRLDHRFRLRPDARARGGTIPPPAPPASPIRPGNGRRLAPGPSARKRSARCRTSGRSTSHPPPARRPATAAPHRCKPAAVALTIKSNRRPARSAKPQPDTRPRSLKRKVSSSALAAVRLAMTSCAGRSASAAAATPHAPRRPRPATKPACPPADSRD